MTTIKDELKRMVIETAYSSKGHFKTADSMGLVLAAYVTIPMVTSLLQTFFAFPEWADKTLSFLGFLFSFLALSSVIASNRDKANQSIEAHIDLGNGYLEIYKEMRVRLTEIDKITPDMLAVWQERISKLDRRTSKSKISHIGRLWSKLRIWEEMDLHWVDGI
jgi:hypothetical protein